MVSPELARITAHICGDGYISVVKQKRSQRELVTHSRKNIIKTQWFTRYVNTEPALVQQFIDDVKKEFHRVTVIKKKHEYEVSGKWIYNLVKDLGAGKSKDWFISKEILLADKRIKSDWLRALFDDEAYVSIAQKRITLNMVNKKGLEQIQKLLNEFHIKSTLRGPYTCKEKFFSFHLCIYQDSILNYSTFINFHHPKKKARLKEIVQRLNGSGGI